MCGRCIIMSHAALLQILIDRSFNIASEKLHVAFIFEFVRWDR